MNIFKKKTVTQIFTSKMDRLNEIEEYLKSWKCDLFFGQSLPAELQNFRQNLISKIEFKKADLMKDFESEMYTEKRNEFKKLEKEILEMCK